MPTSWASMAAHHDDEARTTHLNRHLPFSHLQFLLCVYEARLQDPRVSRAHTTLRGRGGVRRACNHRSDFSNQ